LEARGAYLSLQNHGHPIWYRGIKLRSLGPDDKLDRTPVVPAELTEDQRKIEQRILNWYLDKRKSQ
jgi:hypothetical protein